VAQQNVDCVREFYRAFNERRLDDMRDLLHPEFEWHQHSGLPDERIFRGRDDWEQNMMRGQGTETSAPP
jgi:ketosteroid isomerase-like protein